MCRQEIEENLIDIVTPKDESEDRALVEKVLSKLGAIRDTCTEILSKRGIPIPIADAEIPNCAAEIPKPIVPNVDSNMETEEPGEAKKPAK